MSATEASRQFGAEGMRYLVEHPAEELGLLIKKVRLTLSWEEVPGNYSRSCVRDRFVPGLWLMPLPEAVLWPLNKAADGGSWG